MKTDPASAKDAQTNFREREAERMWTRRDKLFSQRAATSLDDHVHLGEAFVGENLFSSYRGDIISFFRERDIHWHGGGRCDSSIVSSQVAGWLFIFYLVVVTKFCDIGAYLTGRVFGRHPLAPSISPKKTVEGLVGGFVVALAASVSAFEYLKPRIAAVGFSYFDAVVLGILLGGMGVIGDLAESVIKRQANAKDSGGVLPGIGGALDLIDRLLFTVPILYAWLALKMELGW